MNWHGRHRRTWRWWERGNEITHPTVCNGMAVSCLAQKCKRFWNIKDPLYAIWTEIATLWNYYMAKITYWLLNKLQLVFWNFTILCQKTSKYTKSVWQSSGRTHQKVAKILNKCTATDWLTMWHIFKLQPQQADWGWRRIPVAFAPNIRPIIDRENKPELLYRNAKICMLLNH